MARPTKRDIEEAVRELDTIEPQQITMGAEWVAVEAPEGTQSVTFEVPDEGLRSEFVTIGDEEANE